MATGDHSLPTPSERIALIARVQSNTRGHKPNHADRRKLVHETCRQIIEECERAELVNKTAHSLAVAVDDLMAMHSQSSAYVAANYDLLHQAHDRLAFLLSAMQPRKLQAAE